ncbi:MAG: outer membrane protein assembly factor BamA, partial [Deltaproteobacteria bacterium]|nr:outer membrane protein assembly factor BamA [Deltaproteobacteria bacterium]
MKIFRFFKFFLFLSLFLSSSAWAQGKIAQINLVGHTSVEDQVLLSKIYSSPGTTYSPGLISEDIKRLYGLGFFKQIEVRKSGSPSALNIDFIFSEKPPISTITFKGNKKIKSKKLEESIDIKPGTVPNAEKITQAKQKIKELYDKKDYKDAIVIADLKEGEKGSELNFEVIEKRGKSVKKVTFKGNKVFSDRQLKKLIRTKKKGAFSWLTGSGKYQEELLEQDVNTITFAYLNKGYMRVRVGEPEVKFSEEEKGVVVNFSIDEGKPYRVGEVSVEGDILTSPEELKSFLETLEGNLYSQEILEKDMAKLRAFYGNQGYAFVNIRPQPLINDAGQVADISFKIDQGEKVYIEKINIIGNTITRDKVIRRELKVVENSLYNERLIRLSKLKLEQLGYFETVEFATPRGSRDDRLNLNITVKEKPTGTFSVGAGFSSVDKFLLNASISKNNFLGKGLSGSLSAELSSRTQQFSLYLTDPYFLDSYWSVTASAFRIRSRFEDFRRDSFGGGLT